jgi:hypothetical protein
MHQIVNDLETFELIEMHIPFDGFFEKFEFYAPCHDYYYLENFFEFEKENASVQVNMYSFFEAKQEEYKDEIEEKNDQKTTVS